MLEFSYCCSPSAGIDRGARVRVNLVRILLARGGSPTSVTSVPGLPSSITRIMASESSRVDLPLIDSM